MGFKPLRIFGFLRLDMGIEFRGVALDTAVAQYDFNRLFDRDLLPAGLPVFDVEKYHAAISGCGVVHTAGDAVIGEFALPGDMVDLINRQAQPEFIVQRPGQ